MHSLSPRSKAPLSLSIVVPAFNEAHYLATFINELISTLDHEISNLEVIVVNDGSSDHTQAVLSNLCAADPRILGLNLSRNFGKESALSAGLDAARGEAVVLMDADGQHPPPFSTYDA